MDNVEDAEFILAHGTEALGHPSGDSLPMTLEELEKILEQCAAKKIPMVVANPDFVTVEARDLRVMPGKRLLSCLGGDLSPCLVFFPYLCPLYFFKGYFFFGLLSKTDHLSILNQCIEKNLL